MSRTRRVKRVDGTEVERPTPEQMRARRVFVADLLSSGASTRQVVQSTIEYFADPKNGSVQALTEAQIRNSIHEYRQDARASFESEMSGFRSAQRERLYSHLLQARASKNWTAVRGLEKLIGQLEGNFAAVKVEVSTGGEVLARVISGMRPEQVERAKNWAAGRPQVIQGGKGANDPAPSPGALGGQSAEPGAADSRTG